MRVNILLEMIQERGGRLSKSAQKLFSSTEGTPDKSAHGREGRPDTPRGHQGQGDRRPADDGRGRDRSADDRRDRDRSRERRRDFHPGVPRSEIEVLKKRLSELEGDVRSEASRPFDVSMFAEALEKQTNL